MKGARSDNNDGPSADGVCHSQQLSGKQYPDDAFDQYPDCEESQPDDEADNKRKYNALGAYIESGGKYFPGCLRYQRIRLGSQIK